MPKVILLKFGITIMNYYYTVKYRNLIHYMYFVLTVSPPKFLKHPSRANVQFFSSVTFKCTVETFGYATVVWRKVGSILPITAIVKNTSSLNGVTSVLTITGVAGYYGGLYYCISMNQAGSTPSNHAELIVQGTIKVLNQYLCLHN